MLDDEQMPVTAEEVRALARHLFGSEVGDASDITDALVAADAASDVDVATPRQVPAGTRWFGNSARPGWLVVDGITQRVACFAHDGDRADPRGICGASQTSAVIEKLWDRRSEGRCETTGRPTFSFERKAHMRADEE